MTRRPRPQVQLAVLALLSFALPVRANLLSCPVGAEYKTMTTPRYTAEWCVDQKGKKNGPFRLTTPNTRSESTFHDGKRSGAERTYDRDGNLMYETQYENGKKVSEKADRAWLEKQLIIELNDQDLKVKILDSQTVYFEYTKLAPWSSLISLEGEAFRNAWHAKVLPAICKAWIEPRSDLPGYAFERVHTRIVDSTGKMLVEDRNAKRVGPAARRLG